MPVSDGDNFNGGRPRWNGGHWDKSGNGKNRGPGARWSSSNKGRDSYEKHRPPFRHHSEGKRWGETDDRRHNSGTLVPGSSLLGSSNGQSSRGEGRDSGGRKRISSPSGSSHKWHEKNRGCTNGDDLPKLGDGSSREGGGISSSVVGGGENRTTDSRNHPESTSNNKRKWPGSTSSGSGDVNREGDDRREADETDRNKGPNSIARKNRSPKSKNTHKFRIGGDMSVSKRREAKLKELERLNNRRNSVIIAREALSKEMEKKRMEQEEITIQIDAAKRFLALYDSPAAAAISCLENANRASSETPALTASDHRDANGGGDFEGLHVSSSSAGVPGSSQPPEIAQTPEIAQNSTRMVNAHAASLATRVPPETSPSGSGSMLRPRSELSGRGRGGSSARGRIPSSRSTFSPGGFTVAVNGSDTKEHAVGASAEGGAKKGSRKVSMAHNRKGTGNSSSSTSSEDEGGVNGAGNGGSSGMYGYITSMPPVGSSRAGVGGGASASAGMGVIATVPSWDGSKPSPLEMRLEDLPDRVPADGGMIKKGFRGSKGVTKSGVGSFNILKHLMFRATRTKKLRAMAFNPAVSGLFAVCSADQSMDLWQYSQNTKELERVSSRDGVTPGGGAHVAWNPSGTHLAIGHAGTGFPDHWAATIVGRDERYAGIKLRSDKHTKPAQSVAWVTPSKNHQDHLVTGGEDGQVVIWTRVLDTTSDLHKVAVLHSRHKSAVRSSCCPSISPTVVTGGADGRLVSFSIETASVEWEELLMVSNTYHPAVNELLEFPNNPRCLLVSAVDTSRSHSMFAMDTRENTSLIHKARRMTWKRKEEKKPFSTFIYPSISPCGRYVTCAGDWNGCFNLWDVRSGRTEPMQSVLVNPLARVMHTAWHPDPESHVLMSLSNAPGAKSFALHLHGGVRLS